LLSDAPGFGIAAFKSDKISLDMRVSNATAKTKWMIQKQPLMALDFKLVFRFISEKSLH